MTEGDIVSDGLRDRLQTIAKTSRLLSELRNGPRKKSVVARRLDVSESTVYQWGRELDDLGLVERTSEGYRLTAGGWYVATLLEQFAERSRRVEEFQPILDAVPNDALPPVEFVLTGNRQDEQRDMTAVTESLSDAFDRADRVVGVVSISYSPHLEICERAIENGDVTAELAFTTDAAEQLRAEHGSFCRVLAADDDSTLTVIPEEYSFAVICFLGERDSVSVVRCSSTGYPTGIVSSRDETAVDWGVDFCRSHVQAGEPLLAFQ